MTVFNFFLAISGVLVGLVAASLSGDDQYPLAALSLSIFLLALSYIFWQLDIRTSFLIKHAESALELSEKELFPSYLRLVEQEDKAFEEFRAGKKGLAKGLSYSGALRSIFALMAILASIGIVLSTFEIVGFTDLNRLNLIFQGVVEACLS
ncbi:MAG: hypothetical protein V2I30_00265 [Erythrobacter sp.]|jgi:hypothetical protein|nr:hypothetical protein [Erythrobacter sp.]